MGLLLVEGFPVFYTGSIDRGFDILAAAALVILLGKKRDQIFRNAAAVLIVMMILRGTHLISLVIGLMMRWA